MLDTIRPSLAKLLASRMDAPPPRLGIRYDAAGNFLFEPGNTIVCHLARRSASEAAVLQVRERFLALPGADCLAFTPAASLHMTLFQGVVDTRRKHPYWPADIPLHLGIDEMTRRMMTRLDGFDGSGPFSVKVTEVTPTGLAVEGVTKEDANVMRAWRDKLAHTFGYRHPDHDRYSFHITFAYVIRGIPDAVAAQWQRALEESLELLQREAPVIALKEPAFCRFRDMKQFEELMILA
ncbi:DUF1868 domain-containing protein [Dongia sedimenti]|uniref:DUF1868 domain-containing protein n=1 Tax=Dongia sedimenti TaxID=3064282 RepID=A0ABU0YSA5_9PROT|nr:DUF1868 domain-containing protein [Rhodospirillaceae bacterium R-7]